MESSDPDPDAFFESEYLVGGMSKQNLLMRPEPLSLGVALHGAPSIRAYIDDLYLLDEAMTVLRARAIGRHVPFEHRTSA
jgi:hypothetical protein